MRKFRMFSSGRHRWCTYYLKVAPAQAYFAQVRYDAGVKPINAVGIRAEESAARAQQAEVEEQDEATVWRPLLQWDEAQVRAVHAEHGVRPNPLYLQGASRVGCWPCIHARKHELRHLAAVAPERLAHIANLEERVTALRREDNPEAAQATFFKSRVAGVPKMAIPAIVQWATTKDGEAIDDIADIEEEGCMRWGLCEKPARLARRPADDGNWW